MRKNILAVICLSIMTIEAMAQNQSLKETFSDYIAEMNNLNNSKDLTRIARYFDKDSYFVQSYIGLTGRQKRTEGYLADHLNSLKGLVSDQDIVLNLKIDEITGLVEDEYYGTISAKLSLDLVIDGKSLEKNSFSVSMTAIKVNANKWRFIESDVIRTLDERKAGNCVCYFYERKDDFVTEVIYPNGFDFRRILDDFKFRSYDDKRVIKTGYRQFSWAEDGTLKEIYGEGEQPDIGTAKDKKSAVLNILSSFYSDECVDIVVR